MSKKLMYLAFVMLLGLYVAAKADVMIDDFEGYWGQPAMDDRWVTAIANSGLTTRTLITTGGLAGSAQAMQWDYSIPGSVSNSDNLYMLGSGVYDEEGNWTFTPQAVDMTQYGASWNLDFTMKSLGGAAEFGTGAGDIFYMKIYQGGGVVCEAWAKGDGTAPFGVTPMGTIASFMTGEETDFSVHAANLLDSSWAGWPPTYAFSNLTAVTGILIGGCTSGGTDRSGSILIDNLRITPEPATIALLGLGALAMLRRKYSH